MGKGSPACPDKVGDKSGLGLVLGASSETGRVRAIESPMTRTLAPLAHRSLGEGVTLDLRLPQLRINAPAP